MGPATGGSVSGVGMVVAAVSAIVLSVMLAVETGSARLECWRRAQCGFMPRKY
jgi:hypothetical protein